MKAICSQKEAAVAQSLHQSKKHNSKNEKKACSPQQNEAHLAVLH